MGRLILIAVAVLLLVWLVRRALAEARRKAGQGTPRDGDQAGAGELVRCAHCGLNLPRAEARRAAGNYFCSEEHWRLGPKKE